MFGYFVREGGQGWILDQLLLTWFFFFFCGRKNGVVFGGRGNLLGSVGRNFVKDEVRWKIFPFSFSLSFFFLFYRDG